MYTFGPLIAKNNRSGRLLGGAPITVTTLDGTRLDTYTVDGQPLILVTNHEGYAGTFTADTDQRVILARPRGGDPLPLYAHEGTQDAAEAADTINTGRLSEASLMSTFASLNVAGRLQIAGANITPAQAIGDTGRRNVTPSTSVNGGLYVRRVGHTVFVLFDELAVPSDGGSFTSLNGLIPAGFRPQGPPTLQYFTTVPRDSLDHAGTIRISSSGQLVIYAYTGLRLRVSLTYDAPPGSWPTTLPGTPA